MGSCTINGLLMRFLLNDTANVPTEQCVSEQRHTICCETMFGLHTHAIYPTYYHTTLITQTFSFICCATEFGLHIPAIYLAYLE